MPSCFFRYRLAPAHHFPVAYEDVYRVVKHFLQKGVLAQYSVDPERVVVSGDSAGGNLAAAVSQQVQKLLLFLLCGPCPCTGTWSKPTSVSGSKFVFAKSVGAVRIKGGLGWVYSHPVAFFQTSNVTCFLWNRGLDL